MTTDDGTRLHVKKDSYIAISHILPHMITFEKPSEFCPGRYTQRPEQEDKTDPFRFTTFSNGVHKCPGQELAYAQIKVILATMIRQCNLELKAPVPGLDFERATLAQRSGKVTLEYSQAL